MQRVVRLISDAALQWHRFWFAPSDPLPLCVLRWLVGATLVYNHWVWGIDLLNFFGASGWNNAGVLESLQQDTASWSIWWWIPETAAYTFHYVCFAILVLFWIGCCTRITSVLAWAITVSYAHRAMLANFGLDQISAMLTFYLMLAPCGQRLSWDHWWNTKIRRHSFQATPSSAASLATRLIQVHLCVIYVWAGLSKLQGPAWWTGDAVWQAIANHEYQSLDLTWLAQYPTILQLATHGVLLFELTFPFAVLHRRTRPMALAVGAAMHLGIGLVLGMWPFGLVMMFAYIAFFDAATLQRLVAGTRHWLAFGGSETDGPIRPRPMVVGAGESGVIALPAPLATAPEHTVTPQAVAEVDLDAVPAGNDVDSVVPVRIAPQSLLPVPAGSPRKRFVTDELIYVARSKQQRAQVRAYFRRHNMPCLVLRGAAEFLEKTVNRRKATIVLRAKDFSSGELQYWIDELAATNPSGQFRVFLLPDARGTTSTSQLEVPPGVQLFRLSPTTTLRRIRKLYDNQDWDEMPTDHRDTEDQTAHPSRRAAKFMSWLVLALLAIGCGTSKDAPKVQLARARMLLERGQTHDSLQAFNTALAKMSGGADDFYDRGVAYERLGQLEQAAADYTEALRLAPTHARALNNRGVVLAQLGRIEEALGDLNQALEIDPNDALAWSNRGLAHHESGSYLEAISDYSQALFLKKEARLYFQRGNAYVDFEKPEQAIADFTEALKLDDGLVRAHVNRGNALVQLGKFNEAIADLRRANELDRELSMAGAIEQLEQRIRRERWQESAVHRMQAWLATQGFEIRTDSKQQELTNYTLHRTGDAVGIPCLIRPTGPRGAPVFEAAQSEQLVTLESDIALFVIDKESLIEKAEEPSSEQPVWLLDWRFQWRPLASDFVPSQVEVLLGPPVG